jgi:hypothetical protein
VRFWSHIQVENVTFRVECHSFPILDAREDEHCGVRP